MQKSLERARMLMRTKVSMHCESVVLMSKVYTQDVLRQSCLHDQAFDECRVIELLATR